MTEANLPKVLVVEDEALLLFSIADDLRDQGFEVYEATDADKAIAILEREPGIGVVFTDIDMPGSMDGLKLSAYVRDRYPPIRIVITSGKNLPAAADLAASLFLPKPYTVVGVIAALRAAITQSTLPSR
jgi:CheY-like chemotaxis protein